MTSHERSILAAQGYLELGMFSEVWKELHSLPAELLSHPGVLEIFVLSLMGERRWEDALTVARRLRTERPEEPGGFIHEAYCLHELGQTDKALEVLQAGPPSLEERAVFFYNLGCYHARLGHYEEAVHLLEKSFEMDASLIKTAKHDPDLAEMKKSL
ncbi:MAG: TPR end-of-group domain-containing protein [Roseimicrobium sp.]